MKGRLIVSLDQGTTSSRAVVFDAEESRIRAIRTREFRQIYPRPGWVEHDPEDIWMSQLDALKDAVYGSGTSIADVACIGITNQRETVIVWDRRTGIPIHNAIVWQCRRTADICNHLKFDGYDEIVRNKTGLVIDAYFSGTKIKWLLDNTEGARERAEAGELLAGTVDAWLVWKLTGGRLHVTDYSNAARTMLFNINTLDWDDFLLERLGIPKCMLPKVVPSSGFIGETDGDILGAAIPISGMAGDQQAALFGQACFETGSAKNTYGTGCFILMNTGCSPVRSERRLLATIAWYIDGKAEYALEGSVFNAGSAIQWLRDELRLIDSAAQSDVLAAAVPDTGGVYVVPAFTGLGAPYWDMFARGAILGITRGTKREHIIRAVLESIAYQSRDVFEAMKADSGVDLKELKVDGGASVSPFLMQFQADIMNMEVKRPRITETTALGAAYLAGLGLGIWKGREEIAREWVLDRTFTPSMSAQVIDKKYGDWKRAVERSMKWDLA
jgi:glycerol kinase